MEWTNMFTPDLFVNKYCNPIYIREYKFWRFAEVGHIREY
jgi:hypothetical protein